MATYYEIHKALEEAQSVEAVRDAIRLYDGVNHLEYTVLDDDRLMRGYVYSLCRVNHTHWTQELVD